MSPHTHTHTHTHTHLHSLSFMISFPGGGLDTLHPPDSVISPPLSPAHWELSAWKRKCPVCCVGGHVAEHKTTVAEVNEDHWLYRWLQTERDWFPYNERFVANKRSTERAKINRRICAQMPTDFKPTRVAAVFTTNLLPPQTSFRQVWVWKAGTEINR